jgi:hypothetical protein
MSAMRASERIRWMTMTMAASIAGKYTRELSAIGCRLPAAGKKG